jgi:hypothetical protein
MIFVHDPASLIKTKCINFTINKSQLNIGINRVTVIQMILKVHLIKNVRSPPTDNLLWITI